MNRPVPRWIERRGFTLRLPPTAEDEGRQVVRLSLVERRGLTGSWWNVREARAETAASAFATEGDDAEQPPKRGSERTLAGGRALSWRWLRQTEAERLLDQRLRTLQALGYTVADAAVTGRGRWDWLYELVRRGLRPGDGASEPAPGPALRDALERIGLSPDAIVEGVATVLELAPARLREPDGSTVARVDPEQLGVLLPFLVEHGHPEIREIGERWLACPGAAFQLPRPAVERWLQQAGRMGDLLAGRVRGEGLALLGPDALLRLSKASTREPVRRAAEHWLARLA
jgi:hypothetical protein